jgi:hypothetical protein
MDWASAAVGVGGLVVAAMGLIFSYRTRLSPYQQTLYERQLDAANSVLSALGRYHDKARRFLMDHSGTGATWADLERDTADVAAEFFGSFRQSSIILPVSVTEAINAYLEALRAIGEHSAARIPDASRDKDDPGTRLAAAYSVVVKAARQGLEVKALSERTLGNLGSRTLATETEAAIDPLLVKVRAESRIFKNFVDESRQIPPESAAVSASEGGTSLRGERDRLYVDNRNLFLTHTWRPSVLKDQVADISVQLMEHVRRGPKAGQASTEQPLANGLIEKVRYDLGTSFRVFEKYNADENFRLDISAYGPTLCVAEVYFKDRTSTIVLNRYLDFIVSTEATVPARTGQA